MPPDDVEGRSLAERARALTLIADPAFRADLMRAGERLV
jgi:acyl-CoA hydrolase